MRLSSPLRGQPLPQTPLRCRHRQRFHPAAFFGFRICFPLESRQPSDIARWKQKARGLFRVFREAVGSLVGDGKAGPRTQARNPKRCPTRNFLRFSKQHLRVCENLICLCRTFPGGPGVLRTPVYTPSRCTCKAKTSRLSPRFPEIRPPFPPFETLSFFARPDPVSIPPFTPILASRPHNLSLPLQKMFPPPPFNASVSPTLKRRSVSAASEKSEFPPSASPRLRVSNFPSSSDSF